MRIVLALLLALVVIGVPLWLVLGGVADKARTRWSGDRSAGTRPAVPPEPRPADPTEPPHASDHRPDGEPIPGSRADRARHGKP
ncbi:MAG: hypothetical protein AB7W59_12505 [Acidimicrobiia bacterium]